MSIHEAAGNRRPQGNNRPRPFAAEARQPDTRLVWWAVLDGRYRVEVVRKGATRARLRVFDCGAGDRPLLNEEVALAEGARHGPDVADVAAWQARVIALVEETGAKEVSR